MGRIIGISLSVVVLVIGVAFVGAFGAHAVARQQTADEIAIRAPNGIDEERFVRIAGIDQWITIRGQDRSNPVLLVLHGGPGSPESYLVRQFLPLERHFVVVQWDQRGSGKTLGRAGGPVDPNLDIATESRSASTCANTCTETRLLSLANPGALFWA
jgi:pimeloyl-ACP methyl ester carboxylesterase